MKRFSTLQANRFIKYNEKSVAPKLVKGKSMKAYFKTLQTNTIVFNKNNLSNMATLKTISIKNLNKKIFENKLGYKYRDLWKQKKVVSIENDIFSHKLAIQKNKENKLKQIQKAKKKRTNYLIKIGALKPKKLIS